ncbi:hypothetical protein PR048_002027 [Dryococelus australis]|uniref:Uncharacterized protein n=1 Tax=Dryococelus australis TaxID=614101 RepID=A0ABQ9IJ36_9NEOP|nr:hypothetical protein PR048_002027 [Dryococelus australis]
MGKEQVNRCIYAEATFVVAVCVACVRSTTEQRISIKPVVLNVAKYDVISTCVMWWDTLAYHQTASLPHERDMLASQTPSSDMKDRSTGEARMDFRTGESCRTVPLVGGFYRISFFPPNLFSGPAPHSPRTCSQYPDDMRQKLPTLHSTNNNEPLNPQISKRASEAPSEVERIRSDQTIPFCSLQVQNPIEITLLPALQTAESAGIGSKHRTAKTLWWWRHAVEVPGNVHGTTHSELYVGREGTYWSARQVVHGRHIIRTQCHTAKHLVVAEKICYSSTVWQREMDEKRKEYTGIDFCTDSSHIFICGATFERKTHPDFDIYTLFTDEASFQCDGRQNCRNIHMWVDVNPHTPFVHGDQLRFSVNVWVSLIHSMLVGPYLLPNRLTSNVYAAFLPRRRPSPQIAMYARSPESHIPRTMDKPWGPVPWPPRSPDMIPLDYFLWSYMHSLVMKPRDSRGLFKHVRRSLVGQCELCINHACLYGFNFTTAEKIHGKQSCYCGNIFSKNCHARRHERTACTKSAFRAMKHYDNGHTQFMQGDTLKNHIKNCNDFSFASRQVKSSIHPAASMGTESCGGRFVWSNTLASILREVITFRSKWSSAINTNDDHATPTKKRKLDIEDGTGDIDDHEDNIDDDYDDSDEVYNEKTDDSLNDTMHFTNEFPSTSVVKKAEGVKNAHYIFPEDFNELVDKLRYLIDLLKWGDLTHIVDIFSFVDKLKDRCYFRLNCWLLSSVCKHLRNVKMEFTKYLERSTSSKVTGVKVRILTMVIMLVRGRGGVKGSEMRLSATLSFRVTGRSFNDLELVTVMSKKILSEIIPDSCRAIYNVQKRVVSKSYLPETRADTSEIACMQAEHAPPSWFEGIIAVTCNTDLMFYFGHRQDIEALHMLMRHSERATYILSILQEPSTLLIFVSGDIMTVAYPCILVPKIPIFNRSEETIAAAACMVLTAAAAKQKRKHR